MKRGTFIFVLAMLVIGYSCESGEKQGEETNGASSDSDAGRNSSNTEKDASRDDDEAADEKDAGDTDSNANDKSRKRDAPSGSSGVDGGKPNGTSANSDENAVADLCISDAECSDRLFCNGEESCNPSAHNADERGCVRADDEPCDEGMTCDEDSQTCWPCAQEPDVDQDGHVSTACGGDDCDDNDSQRYPGNTEVCDDHNHDDDCDETTFGNRDADEDGAYDAECCNATSEGGLNCGDDCDDNDSQRYPGNTEVCDDHNHDEDCDATTFGRRDADEDGAYDAKCCNVIRKGKMNCGDDCDDNDSQRYPRNTEVCDENDHDEDCDANTFGWRDIDEDGVCDAKCCNVTSSGESHCGVDCDDEDSTSFPGHIEICDSVDNDCDGQTDERQICGSDAGVTGDAGIPGNTSLWPSVANYDERGYFDSVDEALTTPACTVFRPEELGAVGLKHPVVIWGNGTITSPAVYAALFEQLASHGFIVVAANTSDAGSGAEMIECLDWIMEQNETSGSIYEDLINADHIGVSGYSQGGAGALMAGRDSRFVTSLLVSPYIEMSLGGFDPESIDEQTLTTFMISGGSDELADSDDNQLPIFETAEVPIVWGTRADATHLEVIGDGGSYRGPMTAWFRYMLMNDEEASELFKLDPCLLCDETGWTVRHNNLWTD